MGVSAATDGNTFFGLPRGSIASPPEGGVALVGLPWEGGSPWNGSEFGPAAVREISTGYPRLIVGRKRYDFRRCWDCGDITVNRLDAARFFEKVTILARPIYESGAVLGAVGGDHSIAFPLVRTLYNRPLHFIVFDAHRDFAAEPSGQQRNPSPMHGNLSRRIAELPNIRKIIQVGVRDYTPENIRIEQKTLGIRVFSPRMLRAQGAGQVLKEVPRGADLYLSVDLDVLDPSIAPGVTEPVPDGLHYRELKSLLVELLGRGRLAGFDVSELNPTYDPGGFTALMSARVVATLLAHRS